MGKRKFLIGCLIFIVVCLAIFNKSRAVVSQTSDFYVNDSAGVLDNSLKIILYQQINLCIHKQEHKLW